MQRIDTFLTDDDLSRQLAIDVRDGLTATPKTLPPKYFYDGRGSALFEEITTLPEYYPTRTERTILDEHLGEIAALARPGTLIELGAGMSEKSRLVIDTMEATGALHCYVPVDVSVDALEIALKTLAELHPTLDLHGIVADFDHHLDSVGDSLDEQSGDARLIAFLGGTIGNLAPDKRAALFDDLGTMLRPGDTLLLGADLIKDPNRLVRAYDDAAGVTADFNRNVLAVINRALGADFRPSTFEHHAVWNDEQHWIEMRLRSTIAQQIRIPQLDLMIDFAAGEELRTEISAKFTIDGLLAELNAAGYQRLGAWTDPAADFAVLLVRRG
jgi:L-histidine Nalpha-methyltransferase